MGCLSCNSCLFAASGAAAMHAELLASGCNIHMAMLLVIFISLSELD